MSQGSIRHEWKRPDIERNGSNQHLLADVHHEFHARARRQQK
jgi:hypothetical protein